LLHEWKSPRFKEELSIPYKYYFCAKESHNGRPISYFIAYFLSKIKGLSKS
jgi:hypothetical protein